MDSNRQLLTRVWRPLLKKFSREIERACLRRDAYLDHVLAHEAKALKDEIPCRNSPEARAFLQSRLQDLDDRIPVNFSVSPTTIEAVNRACEDLNVIRDCFVNRVLFLLVADTRTCEAVTGLELREYLPDILGDHEREYLYAPLWGGGLSAVSQIVSSDPFWAMRNMIDHFRERDENVAGLHACVILPEMFTNKPAGVTALNCYLPDEFIPESPTSKRATERLEDLLGEILREGDGNGKQEKERRMAK